MRSYETTFIINPQTDDATIEKHVNDIASIITNNKGNILHKDNMGTRRLAYEIDNLTHGYYASFIFEGDSSILPMLDRHYKLNEAYIRYLTVRFEGTLEDLEKDVLFDFKKTDDSNDEDENKDSASNDKDDEESTEGNLEETKSEKSTEEPDVEKDDSEEETKTKETDSTETNESDESIDEEEL